MGGATSQPSVCGGQVCQRIVFSYEKAAGHQRCVLGYSAYRKFTRCCSWEANFVGSEERLDVLGSDPVGSSDAHGLKLPLMDQPLDGATGNLEPLGDLSRGQNFFGKRCVFLHDFYLATPLVNA
jgi:hypothetical protein